MDLSQYGKVLVGLGLGLVVLGLFLWSGVRLSFLGRLPGDLRIEKENFTFYFPLASCLLFSILVSILLWIFSKLK
jgi:hypothetical protein